MGLELKKSVDKAETPERAARTVFLPPSSHMRTDLYSPSVWEPRCPGGLKLLPPGCALLMGRS